MIEQATKLTNVQSFMDVMDPQAGPAPYARPPVSTAETGVPEAEAPPPPVEAERRPCPTCKRSFDPESLANHVRICQKITSKTRTVFNSRQMRANGTPIANYVPRRPPPPEAAAAAKKPSNWRRNHERLIANIRAKKDNSQPPPPPLSHAFSYSDTNNNNRYSARFSGHAYRDHAHLQARQNNARPQQEPIQLLHNV